MNKRVIEQLEIVKQGYIHDPNRILSDYRKETAEISGYHGRELLELLQNAVDELGGTKERSVFISLNDDELIISNNGDVFSFDGLVSLMYSNLSPKHNKNEYIGSKGTGFRSILNWSDSVSIYSGDLSVGFSAQYASEMLTELMQNESVQMFCEKHEDVHVATLVVPRVLPPLQDKDYDTVIIAKLKPNIVNMVINQLVQINSKTILFLEKLGCLALDYQGRQKHFNKETISCGKQTSEVNIRSEDSDGKVVDESWTIASRIGTFKERKYEVMIAYREDMSVKPDVLYSFFKTKVQFPVPVLVHATFDLNADRNHLVESDANEHILKVVCDTIVKLALDTSLRGVDYAPLLLLSTIGKFPEELSWGDFSLFQYYLEAISASKVFPTVNGEYITFDDAPRFYSSDIALTLSGDSFSELMPSTAHKSIQMLMTALEQYKEKSLRYSYFDIVARIDNILPSLSIEQRAKLWFAFVNEYGRELNPDNLPRFALDTDGNPVSVGKQAFLPAEGVDFPVPPDFTKIVLLNRGLVSELRRVRGSGFTLRALASQLDVFGIKEYNLVNIINAVFSRLRAREHQGSKKTRACYEATLEWMWKLWNLQLLTDEMPAISGVPMITRNGEVKNANELYFGREYGNELADSLLKNHDGFFVALPNPKRINLSEETKPAFMDFLAALGVAYYPRKINQRLHPIPKEYLEKIYDNMDFPIIAEDDKFYNVDELRRATFSQALVSSIEGLEDILTHSDTRSILSWLHNDETMWQSLSAYEPPSSKGYVRTGYQQNNRQIGGTQLASYIRHIFSVSKWIDVDGVRYSPSQCVFASKVGTLFAPIVIFPPLETYANNINRIVAETTEIRDIMVRIGAASDYSEMDTKTFYSLLLKLPDVDETGEVSKAIYSAVLKAGGLKRFKSSDSQYQRFLREGKVFCKSSKTYKPISEAFYLTEKAVSKEILKDFELIAIPSRQNQENIKRYFGVNPLRIKGSVIGDPVIHSVNSVFAPDFDDFLCYAFCRRVDIAKQSEVSMVKSLRVQLCSHIDANYGNNNIVLGANAYIRGKNCVYVQAPERTTSIKQLKCDVDFCSTIAELFMSAIDIQDDTLFGYVRTLYEKEPSNRNALILHDFDDLSILERARETLKRTQSEKEQFINACILVGGSASDNKLIAGINEIDFSDFYSVNNSYFIIDILHMLMTDVEEFNCKSEISIDLRPYYHQRLERLQTQNYEKYKSCLYAQLKIKSLEEQCMYLTLISRYCEYPFVVNNSINL